jgi:hypothetical protein
MGYNCATEMACALHHRTRVLALTLHSSKLKDLPPESCANK